MCPQSLPALLGRMKRAGGATPHVSPWHVSPPRCGQASPPVSLAAREDKESPWSLVCSQRCRGAASPSPAN